MPNGFEATASVTIDAGPESVWDVLTNPAKVRQYMHGTEMSTDWREGSPITWRGEWQGRAYEDKGTVVTVQRNQLLRYTHWSPMGGSEDRPENYHTLTWELKGAGGETTLTLTQDNNPTQEAADKMAEESWAPVLASLKKTAEA